MRFLQFIRNNKGNAFVELALVTPLIVLLIGSIFEISRAYYIQNTLEYSAKEAARIGSSVKESVDKNYNSKKTISKAELENLIKSSVRVMGVIEEESQFMIRYLNSAGNEIRPSNNIPFDRDNNPNALDFVEVEISYPGRGPNVNKPVPAIFNPANAFKKSLVLMSHAVFQVEGRFQR